MNISKPPLNRRTFLRAAGVTLALPFLEAMHSAKAASGEVPRRIVAINTNLGILERHFYPHQAGHEYELTPYLRELGEFRDQFTVLSGCSHPDVTGAFGGSVLSHRCAASRQRVVS